MIKYFCDVCGKEMQPKELDRVFFRAKGLAVEIHTGKDSVWNGGHFCWGCIVGAINYWWLGTDK